MEITSSQSSGKSVMQVNSSEISAIVDQHCPYFICNEDVDFSEKIKEFEAVPTKSNPSWKPETSVIWYGRDKNGSSQNWIDFEHFGLTKCIWRANISDSANIKRITVADVQDFQDTYGGLNEMYENIENLPDYLTKSCINWKKFQDDGYDGLEYYPYMKSYRGENISALWWNTVDVPSGFIFDPKLISVELFGIKDDETDTYFVYL